MRERDEDDYRSRRHSDARRSRSPYDRRRRTDRDEPRGSRNDEEEYRRHRESRKRGRSISPERRPRETRVHPAVGDICRASVHTIKAFGVFVALEDFERHALVHHSQVSDDLTVGREDDDEDKITALEYFCPKGSRVWVKITEVRDEGPNAVKVNASMRAVDQESGRDLDPLDRLKGGAAGSRAPQSLEPPELGSVHRATIASLRPFGAFVRIEGYRSNGLVHFTHISDHLEIDRDATDEEKTATIGQVVAVGESCWVKVVEIKPGDPERGPKIGCSIKLVSQKDGRDYDPHGLKFRPKAGDGDGPRGNRRVGADAGEAQQGVVDWGHLNADKVNMDPRYQDYTLVGDEVEGLEARLASGGGPAGSIGSGGGGASAAQGVGSVEEALAILKKHERRKEKKTKSKAKKKRKAKEEKKAKKHKKRSKSNHSSSDSSESD